jgi:hypothetical protein
MGLNLPLQSCSCPLRSCLLYSCFLFKELSIGGRSAIEDILEHSWLTTVVVVTVSANLAIYIHQPGACAGLV